MKLDFLKLAQPVTWLQTWPSPQAEAILAAGAIAAGLLLSYFYPKVRWICNVVAWQGAERERE